MKTRNCTLGRLCFLLLLPFAGSAQDGQNNLDRSNIEYIDVHGDRIAIAGEDAHVRLYRVTIAGRD